MVVIAFLKISKEVIDQKNYLSYEPRGGGGNGGGIIRGRSYKEKKTKFYKIKKFIFDKLTVLSFGG